MAQGKRISRKVVSFEKSARKSMGAQKWSKVAKSDKQAIRQMSECQEKGGPVGSAPVEDKSNE